MKEAVADKPALFASKLAPTGNVAAVLAELQRGLSSPVHVVFAKRLVNIAHTYLTEAEQTQLTSLSERQAQVLTSQEEPTGLTSPARALRPGYFA